MFGSNNSGRASCPEKNSCLPEKRAMAARKTRANSGLDCCGGTAKAKMKARPTTGFKALQQPSPELYRGEVRRVYDKDTVNKR